MPMISLRNKLNHLGKVHVENFSLLAEYNNTFRAVVTISDHLADTGRKWVKFLPLRSPIKNIIFPNYPRYRFGCVSESRSSV